MGFEELLSRLRMMVRVRICNGEITERGLARQIGISQSHIHNVLCGVRTLTPNIADRLLEALEISVTQLIEIELSATPRKESGRVTRIGALPRPDGMYRGPLPRSSAS